MLLVGLQWALQHCSERYIKGVGAWFCGLSALGVSEFESKEYLSESVKRWSMDIMTLRNMLLPFLPGITPMDRKER